MSYTLARDARGQPVQAMRPDSQQTVAIGAASAQTSAAFDEETLIEVTADQDCFIKLGANPTAVATDTPVWAKTYRAIRVNEGDKLAVIRATTDGTLYISQAS